MFGPVPSPYSQPLRIAAPLFPIRFPFFSPDTMEELRQFVTRGVRSRAPGGLPSRGAVARRRGQGRGRADIILLARGPQTPATVAKTVTSLRARPLPRRETPPRARPSPHSKIPVSTRTPQMPLTWSIARALLHGWVTGSR